MVLMCEVRIAEGKPQVEGYAAGELAASAGLVVPGAGPLAGMLTALDARAAAEGRLAQVTGVAIGRRQLQQITAEAAADAAGFEPALPGEQRAGPLALSPDAKGVAMLPGALRRRGARAPGQRVRNFARRRGTGEKGHKRMA